MPPSLPVHAGSREEGQPPHQRTQPPAGPVATSAGAGVGREEEVTQRPTRTADGRAERQISEEGDDGPALVGKSYGVELLGSMITSLCVIHRSGEDLILVFSVDVPQRVDVGATVAPARWSP